jgi:hypothetical protein
MNRRHTSSSTAPHRRLPAWGLSSILHLLSLLLLAICFQSSTPAPATLPERPVAIVLASPLPTKNRPATQTIVGDAEPASTDVIALPAMAKLNSQLMPAISLPGPAAAVSYDSTFLNQTPRSATGSRIIPSAIDSSDILAAEAERRQRLLARGPAVAVEMFGSARAEGRSFLFLIDRSKSMGRQGLQALAAAEAELIRGLSQLKPNHRFQVMAYHHHSVYLIDKNLLPATKENLEAIRGYLSKLAAFGATDHEKALRTALTWEPDVLFLLTDGGEPGLTAAQIRMISRRAAGTTAIHCIEFGYGPQRQESNFLTRLADENSGSYGYVNMSQREH